MIKRLKTMWDDRENQARYMKWLMQYSKPYIGKIILVMLLGIASTVASLVMVQISKVIIDNASFGNAFVRLLVVYLLLMLLMQGISIVNTLVSTMLTERFSFGIRKQIYEKIIRSHWMSITKYHTGDLMTRLTSDAGNIADGIIGTIPNIIMLIVELVMVFLHCSIIRRCLQFLRFWWHRLQQSWHGGSAKSFAYCRKKCRRRNLHTGHFCRRVWQTFLL